MKKKALGALIIVLLILVGIILYSTLSKPKACFEGECFELEIADTSEERQEGLMNRSSLEENKGMLFVFEKPGKYSFWMKNTKIPLDMIWINSDNEIVHIKHNAQPCKKDPCESYGPDEEANYVLEINGGLAKKTGLKKGDRVKLQNAN